MSESPDLLAAAERFRTVAAALSNPRDAMVVRQYVCELELRARSVRHGRAPVPSETV